MPALDNLAKIPRRAMARAINRTLNNARTQSVKSVREEYTIRAFDLKRNITTGRASSSRLSGYIGIDTDPIPLGYFSPSRRIVQSRRGTRVGVSVKVRRKKPPKLVKRGFQPLRNIGTSMEQRRKIFKSLGKKKISARGKRKGKTIETIVPMISLSYAAVFKASGEKKLREIYDQDLYKKFNDELENYLNRERSKK